MVVVLVSFFFQLNVGELEKGKRTKRQIELWTLFASHIFIQNDKATFDESCSVFFFLSLAFSLLFSVFSITLESKLVLLTEYVDAFSCTLSRKRKKPCRKTGKKQCRRRRRSPHRHTRCFSITSNFSCQFSLCATKEKRRKKEKNDASDR